MTTQQSKLGAAIDAGVTLLAGASAAFVLFAMPQDLLARALAAVRLSSFSPRFQPPIADGVRFALVAAAGLVTLAFVWSLMKALDRAPAGTRPEPARAAEPDPEAPRLRKADAHPDAPARRPLLAGRDLGEPLELDPADVLDEPFDAASEAEEEFVPQPEPLAAVEASEPLPSFLVPQAPEPQCEDSSEPAPERQPEWEPSPEQASEPEPEWEPSSEHASEPEPEWEPSPVDAPEPEPEPFPAHASAPEPEVPAGEESIVSLMHRFETGLGRKKQALADRAAVEPVPAPSAPPPVIAREPEPEPPLAAPAPVGHRLRSAIAGLQRVSGG